MATRLPGNMWLRQPSGDLFRPEAQGADSDDLGSCSTSKETGRLHACTNHQLQASSTDRLGAFLWAELAGSRGDGRTTGRGGRAMAVIDNDLRKMELLLGAKFLHAYLECSNEIQAGIRELLVILDDPATDEDDRLMTLRTLADALFPNPHHGLLGIDLEESETMGAQESDEMRAAVEEMDREEATFAERLDAAMREKGLTQEQLAKLAGVGQPAISNMLNRRCRPQRRTVLRFAEALDVAPESLFPGISQK